MKIGTSDELLLVLSILSDMKAESGLVQRAREIALADLQNLIEVMSEGQPVLQSAQLVFGSGKVLSFKAGDRLRETLTEQPSVSEAGPTYTALPQKIEAVFYKLFCVIGSQSRLPTG